MYIVATLGPKTMSDNAIQKLIGAGTEAFRINMSHISKDNIKRIVGFIKSNYPDVKIIGDITGKKVRVSEKLKVDFKITKGEEVIFTVEDQYDKLKKQLVDSKLKIVPLNIKQAIIEGLEINDIYIKDGRYRLTVIGRKGSVIQCRADSTIYITKGKSCTIKSIDRSNMDIPDRDIEDLEFLMKNDVDIVLLSFISSAEDIRKYKEKINAISSRINKSIEVWAKVETKDGVKNIRDICSETDTIVFGRGDMSAEGGIFNLPLYQWEICRSLHKSGKMFIVATNIMDNVSLKGRPSTSELNDIFTMMKNGVNGFMLTSETSVSTNGPLAVQYLCKACNRYSNILNKRKIKNDVRRK